MKIHTEYLTFHTKTKRAYVHITPQVESALKKSAIKDGMVLISAMHITAGRDVDSKEKGLDQELHYEMGGIAALQDEVLPPHDAEGHTSLAVAKAAQTVLVATVSLLGHRTSIEEVVLQNKVSDQWAYYQAKNIRRHNDELFADIISVVNSKDAEAAGKLQEKYRAEADRYRDEQKE